MAGNDSENLSPGDTLWVIIGLMQERRYVGEPPLVRPPRGALAKEWDILDRVGRANGYAATVDNAIRIDDNQRHNQEIARQARPPRDLDRGNIEGRSLNQGRLTQPARPTPGPLPVDDFCVQTYLRSRVAPIDYEAGQRFCR